MTRPASEAASRFKAVICAALVLAQLGIGRPMCIASEGPLTPDEALKAFQLEPGLQIELVAAEPLVVDPVALCFDEHGRLFVAENRDYPTGPSDGKPRGGMVALLEDRDADGTYDTRTDFATDLAFPNGLMPWEGGLFVTDAPDVLYLKDEDGDGVADLRKVVLTGFAVDKSTQLRVNDPTLALDGWVYLAGGLSAGTVRSPVRPDQAPLDLRRHDLRFDPETFRLETTDGKSQFGLAIDDRGNRFICMNRIQVQHVVLDSSSLARNPLLNFSDTVQNLPEERIDDLLRGENSAARIFPISDNLTTADSHAGTFSAACAVTVYRGHALPPRYVGRVFSCDPTGNLVHWDSLGLKGATFVARRSPQPIEFVASRDNWFRPVFLAEGPDGALYVCDMYRKTIEHPDYLPEEIRRRTDFAGGSDMGRIWKVRQAVGPSKQIGTASVAISRLEFDRRDSESLVDYLGHANHWHRQTAFRLLMETEPDDLARRLEEVLASAVEPPTRRRPTPLSTPPSSPAGPTGSTNVLPLSPPGAQRIYALCLLDLMGHLKDATLVEQLTHPEPAVRQIVWRLFRNRTSTPSEPILHRILRAAVQEPDAQVRFQSALAVGNWAGDPVLEALAQFARLDGTDRWAGAAILSGLTGRSLPLLRNLLTAEPRLIWTEFAGPLGVLVRREAPQEQRLEIVRLIVEEASGGGPPWQWPLLAGLLDTQAESTGRSGVLDSLQAAGCASNIVERFLEQANTVALDALKPLAARIAAIDFLACQQPERSAAAFLAIIGGGHPFDIQVAAVRRLVELSDDAVADLMSARRWPAFTPPLRRAILQAVLARPAKARIVVDLLVAGELPATALSTAQRQRLLQHSDPKLRARAERIFGSVNADPMAVFNELKAALETRAGGPASPDRGRAAFAQHCASCHRLDREGHAVGPDLFGMRNQPKEAILLHIVVPNQEIAPGFEAYELETEDGRILSGLISSESAGGLTLRQALGLEETFDRSQIRSLRASALSLMPEGLAAAMSETEVADLLSFLKGESGVR